MSGGSKKAGPGRAETSCGPPPHNALYDFEATKRGAGWIDAAAAEAKAVVDDFRGRIVVGHIDWSVDQARVEQRRGHRRLRLGLAPAGERSSGRRHRRRQLHLYLEHRHPQPADPRRNPALCRRVRESSRWAVLTKRGGGPSPQPGIYATAYLARCEHAVDIGRRRFPREFPGGIGF